MTPAEFEDSEGDREATVLRRRLRDLARTPHPTPRGRRTALTFRARGRTAAEFPSSVVPLDDLEFLTLALGRGRRRDRVTLAVYRLAFDPASPRGFRPERRYAVDPGRGRAPGAHDTGWRRDARDALALARAAFDAGPADLGSPPRWPRLLGRDAAGALVPLTPVDRDEPRPAGACDGTPLADLTGLLGRNERSPAFDTLADHGLLDRRQGYAAFLDSVSRRVGGRRVVCDPRDDRSPAGRFRAALTAYATADPRREATLFADLAVACQVAGVPVPGSDDRLDALAVLVDNPWDRVRLPRAAAVQVVRGGDLFGPRPAGSGGVARATDLTLPVAGAGSGRRRRRGRGGRLPATPPA